MADQNITELPVKTSSGITSSDYMLGIDSAEGYQMLIRDLGDYIIRNVQVNTIAGSNQTLKSALDALNSNKMPYFSDATFASGADLNQIFYGTHCCNTNALHQSILHKPDGMTTSIWRFTVVPLTNDGASNPTAPANWSRRAQIIYTGETEYWRVYQVDGSGNISFGNWIDLNAAKNDLNRTKFLVISSGTHNTIRISGVTYGATAAIPCFIGTKFGVMNVGRSGSVMNTPTFYGTDKPTNTITKAQDSNGTFHFDISVDTWTSCTFIWRRDGDAVDANVSISAIDT